MSLTELSLGGNNLLIPAQGEEVTSRLGTEMPAHPFFLLCTTPFVVKQLLLLYHKNYNVQVRRCKLVSVQAYRRLVFRFDSLLALGKFSLNDSVEGKGEVLLLYNSALSVKGHIHIKY
jgi:hypothetical protein